MIGIMRFSHPAALILILAVPFVRLLAAATRACEGLARVAVAARLRGGDRAVPGPGGERRRTTRGQETRRRSYS
ncbi:MAG: hypothetical protein MZW92_53235 [Comamonadaceae bacterium]|nr:hypothetical protein [Comamonadaceae bacterium]